MARRQNVEAHRSSMDPVVATIPRERDESPEFAGGPLFYDEVAERAYELFLARGSEDGHDLDDWLEAERLVLNHRASDETIQ